MDDLTWLRTLLEDQPNPQTEASTGDGHSVEFTLSNGPALPGSIRVALDGVALAESDFTLVPSSLAPRAVSLAATPAIDAHVVIHYDRQAFGDTELDSYLALAEMDWPEPERQLARVYRAAVLAVDSLLMGAATAMRFGAGNEEYDLPSVLDRLERLRGALLSTLAAEAARPRVIEPTEAQTP